MDLNAQRDELRSLSEEERTAASTLAREMYETEREMDQSGSKVSWSRLSQHERRARILTVSRHVPRHMFDTEVSQLEVQVREQTGDYLTALSDLADLARGLR